MQMSSFSIYYLIDPIDGRVRYVGYSRKPEKRYEAHILQSFACRTHKETWIWSLVKQDILPILSIRCIVQGADEAKRLEVALIASLKRKGIDLTNGTRGGDGSAGFKWSQENFRKHKEWYKAHKHLPNPCKGRKQTPEHVAATKAANTPELLARRGTAIKAGWAKRNGAPTKKHGKGWSALQRKRIIEGKGLDQYVPDSQVSPAERLQRQLARAEKKHAKLKAEMANGTD
jgi:hypothetical protein